MKPQPVGLLVKGVAELAALLLALPSASAAMNGSAGYQILWQMGAEGRFVVPMAETRQQYRVVFRAVDANEDSLLSEAEIASHGESEKLMTLPDFGQLSGLSESPTPSATVVSEPAAALRQAEEVRCRLATDHH